MSASTAVFRVASLVAAMSLLSPLAIAEEVIRRHFSVDAEVVSYVVGEGLDAYQQHGSGMAGVSGTTELDVRIDDRSIQTGFSPRLQNNRLFAKITFATDGDAKPPELDDREIDFSDLAPHAIQLGTDAKGRVYQLNLVPQIRVIDDTPRPLSANELQLQMWRFPDSIVLVDDSIYVGRVGGSGGPLVGLDIAGVAKVEFALCPISHAKPTGVLRNGRVTLTNPDGSTTIQISNAHVGEITPVQLPDHPYQVWVRWLPASATPEELRKEIRRERERATKEGAMQPEVASQLESWLNRKPGPWILGASFSQLTPDDALEPSE